MNIFDYTEYKPYLKDLVAQASVKRGLKTKLAMAAGCQKSYFTNVLNGDFHLTPDHAFSLSRFLNHDEDEQNYLITMINHEKAGQRKYRSYLRLKLDQMQENRRKLASLVKNNKKYSEEIYSEYYSSWMYCAIHVLTSIPAYQSAPAISSKIAVDVGVVERILKQLELFGLVSRSGDKWMIANHSLHIEENSPYVLFHHGNWRSKALDSARFKNPDDLHYTSVFSLSDRDFATLREMLMEFVRKKRSLIAASPEEAMVSFNFDLFRF
jgi:uncharacterized protein (TIGR02147 family)